MWQYQSKSIDTVENKLWMREKKLFVYGKKWNQERDMNKWLELHYNVNVAE